MRSKEEAHDYRYFPEPDLPPLVVGTDWVEAVEASLPELPWTKESRFVDAYGLSGEDAVFLAGTRELAGYYERVARAAGDGKAAANWVMTEVMRCVKEEPQGFEQLKVEPEHLGEMIRMIGAGEISGTIGKQVFAEMAASGGGPRAIVEAKGLRPIGDAGAVAAIVDRVLADHAGPVRDYLNGKNAAFQFLVGQIMRSTGGRADPGAARAALQEALDARRRDAGAGEAE
jgi:aspartyl-tRNA(Asn)/glutamyl-tRNA(Gln) amidotransferase subunit B